MDTHPLIYRVRIRVGTVELDFNHKSGDEAEAQYRKYDGLDASVKLFQVNGQVTLVKENGR